MARDPYEVLGVPRTASIDEIKAKYKELVKKYHPDKHKDNPLSELAEEKFKEIQEAYESIIKGKASSYSSSYSYSDSNSYSNSYSNSSYNNYSNYSYNSIYQEVRQMINNGNYSAAEAILDANQSNDAEWFFLKSVIFAFKGSYYKAQDYLNQALKRDPSNPEYIELKNKLEMATSSGPYYYENNYSTRYRSREMADDLCCNCLSLLCCLQCCCGSS